LPQFKELVRLYSEYYMLAEEIARDLQREEPVMRGVKKLEVKTSKVLALRSIVVDRWQEAHGEKVSSNYEKANSNYERGDSNYDRVNSNNRGYNHPDDHFDLKNNQSLSRVDSKISAKYSNQKS
jgi:hypothetical protein